MKVNQLAIKYHRCVQTMSISRFTGLQAVVFSSKGLPSQVVATSSAGKTRQHLHGLKFQTSAKLNSTTKDIIGSSTLSSIRIPQNRKAVESPFGFLNYKHHTRLFSSPSASTALPSSRDSSDRPHEQKKIQNTLSSESASSPSTLSSSSPPAKKKPSETIASLKKLWAFATDAKKEIILGLIFLPPALASQMALPYYVGLIVDEIGRASQIGVSPDIESYIIGLFTMSVIGAVATTCRNYYIHYAGEIITKDIRNTLFRQVLQKNTSFFDRSKTGDLVNRLSLDTQIISSTLTESVSMFFRGLATMIAGSGFLAYTSWQLALVSLCTLLPTIGLSRWFGSISKKKTKDQLDMLGAATAYANETISNVRTVSLFGGQQIETERFAQRVDDTYTVGKQLAMARSLYMGSTTLVISLSMLSVLGYGTFLVMSDSLTAGELTSFLMYAVYLGGSLAQLFSVYNGVLRAQGAGERIFEITSNVADNVSDEGIVLPADSVKGAIEFRNVNFAYPQRPDQQVCTGLDLSIPAGASVAVVGPSGCGKSTLIYLLTRFYELEEGNGEICLDGTPVQSLKLSWLRNQFGTVTQDASVFSSSIADNIKYGSDGASQDEIEEAARQANAHDFIMSFPDQYDTVVGERGASLSGGQRQRLCIARAILKNPKVLLLDEATSALDVESEFLVQQALDRLMVGRTTMIIAHRLSTIQNSDYIAVLQDGKVAEFGKREEVMNKENGLFNQYLKRTYENRDKKAL